MTRTVLRIAVSAAVLFGAVAAWAAEGRIPVFAPGTVIAADGKYIVTRNIAGPPPVINIVAPNVDLDLNGFTITNMAAGADTILVGGAAVEVRIHNGTVVGGSCVNAPGTGRKLIVEEIECQNAMGAVAAIRAFDIENVVIRRNTIVGAMTTWNIALDGAFPGKNGAIEENVIRGTAGSGGIQVAFGGAMSVRHNRISGVGTIGMDLDGNGMLISENTVIDAGAWGINMRQGRGNKFFDNVVRNSAFTGIFIGPGAGDNLILNNVVTGNGMHGIEIAGAQNLVERNTMNSNMACGLFFNGGFGNTFGRNMARGNAGVGCGPCGALFPPESCDIGFFNTTYGDNLIPGPPVF